MLAITPASGPIVVHSEDATQELPAYGLGNGAAVFHPSKNLLATGGTDGLLRLYSSEPLLAVGTASGQARIFRVS